MRPRHPHACPYCACQWERLDDLGVIDRTAPFYGLLAVVEREWSALLAEDRRRRLEEVA